MMTKYHQAIEYVYINPKGYNVVNLTTSLISDDDIFIAFQHNSDHYLSLLQMSSLCLLVVLIIK